MLSFKTPYSAADQMRLLAVCRMPDAQPLWDWRPAAAERRTLGAGYLDRKEG